MASMNSAVLAYTYAISGAAYSELHPKHTSMAVSAPKLPVIKAQLSFSSAAPQGRRAALSLFVAAAAVSSANAGVIEEYLEKSKVNKELNDKKRLAMSGANFARAYTVEFGSCKFPENFTSYQDLAKQKKVPFLVKIWSWNARERTNTSVDLMFSGNGEHNDRPLPYIPIKLNKLFSCCSV